MGWEYVWHCHLLGHEENDMMREQVFQVNPQTPVNLSAVKRFNGINLTFTDMSQSETGFTIQRATNAAFTAGVTNINVAAKTGWNTAVSFLDTGATGAFNYFYHVRSYKPDADYWNPLIGTGTLPNLTSAWSNVPTLITQPILQITPMALNFGVVAYNKVSAPQTVTLQNIGAGTITLTSIRIIAGATPNSFGVPTGGNKCTATILSGASCTITLVLNPTIKAAQSASLVFTSTDPANPTQSVALTGTQPALPFGDTTSVVDSVSGMTTVVLANNYVATGWAVDPIQGAPVTNVQVAVDGVAVGNATLGIARPDVVAYLGGNAAYLNSGWTFTHAAAGLSLGTHTVSATATNSFGLSAGAGYKIITVAATPPPTPPMGSVDRTVDSVTLLTTVLRSHNILASGWAVDAQMGAPISRVTFFIDGTAPANAVGNATLGIARPDVVAYLGNPAYLNSGFTFTMPASGPTVGTHYVYAYAYNTTTGLSTNLGYRIITVQ
jgi:hypothetical protein